MSHEEFWSWLYIMATAPPPEGLGWSPRTALSCDMSDILLTIEGRRLIRAKADEGKPQTFETSDFASLFGNN